MAEKITIAMKFAATIALMKGEAPEMDWDADQAVAFLEDRAAKAVRKPAKNPKPRKVDPALVEFRENVKNWLATQEVPVTASDVAEAMTEAMGEDVSVQKASHALRWLVEQGMAEAHDGEKSRDAKSYTYVAPAKTEA